MIGAEIVEPIAAPSIDWFAIAPVIAVFGAAIVIVLGRALIRHNPRVYAASLLIAYAGLLTAGAFCAVQWEMVRDDGPYQAIRGMVAVDGFSVFVQVTVLVATFLGLLVASGYLKREELEGPEYIALLLCSATGMMLMASANDLIVVFLALEILSIALYVLVAYDRRRASSQEAGLKYFLLGSFSSAVFLYGVALVYGATGSTNLTQIADYLATTTLLDNGTLIIGMALMLVGLGFKVAAVPFHMWTPDVYEGAPTPVTAFMSGATKAAAFAAMLRIFLGALGLYRLDWRPAIWGLAFLSLFIGTIAAAVQTDVKRMLAYSSIAHAGFILIGVQAADELGTSAALFYSFVYVLMALGAFALVMLVGRRGDERHGFREYRGLATSDPIIAGLLTFFLLAQAGIPLTGGFVAKLSVFEAAVDAGQYILALVGMIASVVAAFVYLRVILAMYAPADDEEGPHDTRRIRIDSGTAVALTLSVVALLFIGLFPGRILDFAHDATMLLTAGQ